MKLNGSNACRAGSAGPYPWGNDPKKLNFYAWYWITALGRTHSVGGKWPNAFGLHDIQGNVWEWVEDLWHKTYVGAPNDGRPWTEGGDPEQACAPRRAIGDLRSSTCAALSAVATAPTDAPTPSGFASPANSSSTSVPDSVSDTDSGTDSTARQTLPSHFTLAGPQ